MMAGVFGVDSGAAAILSAELASIRATLTSLGSDIDGARGQTGASAVEGALERFVHDSNDSRDNLDKLLARAIGLVNGLVDGTTAIDAALVQALGPPGPAGPATTNGSGGLGSALGAATVAVVSAP